MTDRPKNIRSGIQKSSQRDFHATARELTHEDLEVMHLPERYWQARRSEIDENERLREVLDGFCESVPRRMTERDPSLILLHGDDGTGKTSASAIFAKAVRAHKFTVFFLDGPTIMTKFVTNEITKDDELTYRERAFSTDLLVIDALGQGYSKNDFVAGETAALVKHRQDHRLMTVVTTSASMEDLKKIYGKPFVGTLMETALVVPCIQRFRDVHTRAGGE